MVRRVYATQHPQHCVPRREGHRWRFFPHERLQPLRATQHDGRIREEQRRPRSRARRWRFGRTSLLRLTEPALRLSPNDGSGSVGDLPSGCPVRHPQFLDGSRPTSKAGGDGQLPKKHGHTRSAANDLRHPAAVADESRSLIRDNCRKSPFHSVTLHQGVLSEMAGYVNYPCRRQQSTHWFPFEDFRLTVCVALGSTLTCSASVWRSGKSTSKYPWSALSGMANRKYSPGITPAILY